jgi:hypothetical protein
VLPDKSPGIKYPQFFSPDSKTLSYRIGEDLQDRNYDRHSETILAEYSLDTGKRNTWALGVRGAWDLQRVSDDRVIFEAIQPTNKEMLRRFARRAEDADGLYNTGLFYTFDKSTGALSLDPVNELSTYFRRISPYRHFSLVRVVKGQRYYLVDNGYRDADFLVADQGKMTQFAPLGGEVRDFRVSDDEKWLAYVYTDWSDDRPLWQYSGYDEDLGIRNLVTGETHRIDLREPPFSDIAHQQRFGCVTGPVAWLGDPPFDDVGPEPPLVDSTLVRQIVLVLISLATLVVWIGGGIVSSSMWSALGISVMGTLLSGFVLLVFTVSQPEIGHDMYDFGFVLALIVGLLGYLLPAGAIVAVVTLLIAKFIRRRRAPKNVT